MALFTTAPAVAMPAAYGYVLLVLFLTIIV